MEKTENIKKLLCYNIVNYSKCLYRNKCLFAHSLEDQKKDSSRQYIYDMIYTIEDLSNINIYNDKTLFDEINIFTKECKNCISKKCPGGYNCKFGACTKDIKICYNDIMYGKCYNILRQENTPNNLIIKRCIHGVHLTEKNIIPYYLRIPIDFNSGEFTLLKSNNINYNSKNNIISLLLNDETIGLVKDLISNKNNKLDIINDFKNKKNNLINSDNSPGFESACTYDKKFPEKFLSRDINLTESNSLSYDNPAVSGGTERRMIPNNLINSDNSNNLINSDNSNNLINSDNSNNLINFDNSNNLINSDNSNNLINFDNLDNIDNNTPDLQRNILNFNN